MVVMRSLPVYAALDGSLAQVAGRALLTSQAPVSRLCNVGEAFLVFGVHRAMKRTTRSSQSVMRGILTKHLGATRIDHSLTEYRTLIDFVENLHRSD